MAQTHAWIEGIRLRTLPAAIAPVLVGVGAGASVGPVLWGRAALALAVALAFQVGVNFANDYSDGIRGSDDERTGPQRLVASGAASAKAVKLAAIGCFLAGILAGVALVWVTGHWWLLIVGAACIPAAWFYTGGKHPYGYVGLGEVGVFAFFGLVAVLGTAYTQHAHVPWTAYLGAVGIGFLACAVLMANNIRDLVSDSKAGKKTLAVRLGDHGARTAYALEIGLAFACAAACAFATPRALVVLVLSLPAARACAAVLRGATGPELVAVLKVTGQLELAYGLLLGIMLAVSG